MRTSLPLKESRERLPNSASGYRLVIEKSTVPVQTGAQLQKHLSVHSRNGLSYDVASNPEFLREGSSVEDFLHPDRIVIGVDSPRAEVLLREIYEPIIEQKFYLPVAFRLPGTRRLQSSWRPTPIRRN